MVFASFLLMVTAGASYIFSKDLGANIGLLSGLINEVTPPWVVLSVGAALNFFGNFMIFLAVTRRIAKPQVWHMCTYIAVGANSHTFTNTDALVTCVKNFPESRGVVLGLLKGYTGISAAVIAQLYRAFYGDDTKHFTLFVAWLPTALSFAFLKTIRIIKLTNRPQNDVKVFYKFLYLSMCLAGFLLVIIIVEKTVIFNQMQYGLSAIGILFLLFLPLVVVVIEEYKLLNSSTNMLYSTSSPHVSSSPGKIPTPIKAVRTKQVISCWENVLKPPEIGEDFTILQALFSVEMLTLLLSTICGLGGTMTMMDNLGQIGTSFGYPLRKVTNFVSLTSIWIYLGQITVGILSEVFITKYKHPRPLFLTLILLLSSIGHLIIAFNVPNGLYVATVIIGFCFGAFWPLIYTIILELFRLKYYSTLYNFGGLASPIGLYLLNVKVTGYYYDKEAKRQMVVLGLKRKPGQALNCIGGKCFKLSFIIIAVVTLFGAVVSLVLVMRTRKFYKGDIYIKFREDKKISVVVNNETDGGPVVVEYEMKGNNVNGREVGDEK
ncbi:hypothetical protein TIFTF001_022034 [Ficus carica]|uniref:Nodulin-like domain-containing protein n=1 Tax=Ficus carica TaxID=3494 RepID=A0AA88DF58_FICCA|nr:hypothetical protein TIFTF001_022034 [Ficus carica]